MPHESKENNGRLNFSKMLKVSDYLKANFETLNKLPTLIEVASRVSIDLQFVVTVSSIRTVSDSLKLEFKRAKKTTKAEWLSVLFKEVEDLSQKVGETTSSQFRETFQQIKDSLLE